MFDTFYNEWEGELGSIDHESLDVNGRVDYHLLRRRISADRLAQARNRTLYADLSAWLPFAPDVIRLVEARLALHRLAPREIGGMLSDMVASLAACTTFLWGGETIGTSYSHKVFTHEQKLSSMRSNCVPFQVLSETHNDDIGIY